MEEAMKAPGRFAWRLPCAIAAALLVASHAGVSSFASANVRSAGAGAQRYLVVLTEGEFDAGYQAIRRAGGTIVHTNKLGIATVTSSDARFEDAVQHSTAVVGVARNAGFYQAAASVAAAVPPPPNTHSQAAEAGACASLYSVPATIGPDPLGP